ncbi:MAG: MotA/TolQ/ExbB proton channel family protein [Kiritimatiellaeota bacterium]|nr:MotA/TolQ/ExbB proton channel family protein [Kiritimatiellota bacterium]
MNWAAIQGMFEVGAAGRLLAAARDYWNSGGPLMPALAVVAFLIWQRYLVLSWRLRQAVRNPDACVLELDRELRRPANASGSTALEGLPGAVPRVALRVVRQVARGLSFREAFSQCRQAELSPFAHAFYLLGALVAAAPLLGLLGTVLGMIQTFDAVGARSADTTDMVARGISQALITTQVGLLAALPGTFGLAHVHRLYKSLANSLDRCESHLALVLEHGRESRRPGQLRSLEAAPPKDRPPGKPQDQ